jgi:hypothetical protein
MYDISPTPLTSRSKILHADGISAFSGSLNFDVTANAMDVFTTSKLLGRGYKFNIGINDGGAGTDTGWLMNDCYITNLSLTGSASGIVTASLSYVAKSGKTSGTVTNAYILDDYSSSTDNQPLGYWWSGAATGGGAADVKDWTFTMNQAVTPIYLNQDVKTPQYLKVGLIDYQLDVVLYNSSAPTIVNIQSSSFTLTGISSAQGYTFNGVTDLGMYSHSYMTAVGSAGNYKSDGVVIS